MAHCCQNSNLVLILFLNHIKYWFNENCQLNYFFKKTKANEKLSRSTAAKVATLFVFFLMQRNFFLRFLVLFLRRVVALAIHQSVRVASLHLVWMDACHVL